MSLSEVIAKNSLAFTETADLYPSITEIVGDAEFVLIGEASHGTHEFYKCRAEITQYLISEMGFSAVAVEADFPDAYRVNRYVTGRGNDENADQALGDFERFPLWMWRNADVLDFVGWLRAHNEGSKSSVGFYGIDLYSLHSSMSAVLKYLSTVDPEAAKRARHRYSCFDHYGEDAQVYGYAANRDADRSCEDKVVEELIDLRRKAADYMNRDGFIARDEYFYAEQNARLVKNAEQYYREMYRGRESSWNLRDSHMAETLFALADHLKIQGLPPKIVVWAHNSHLGDARATDMARRGEWNVGQLVRERAPEKTRIIGFTTYMGTVSAAQNWDEPARLRNVRPGLRNSWELTFHETGVERFLLDLRQQELRDALSKPLLQRAIGVIYRPETERASHYFDARISEQFDAVIHYDTSSAVEPLDLSGGWSHEDVPETFPEGL